MGPAFTFRFAPAREDLATPASWGSPISTRAAIEAMPEGAFAVIDAMGVADAGVFGDILCARMVKRKAAGLVTDGMVRDLEGVLETGWGGRHPGCVPRRRSGGGGRAGTDGGVDCLGGRAGRKAAWSLPDECRNEGAL